MEILLSLAILISFGITLLTGNPSIGVSFLLFLILGSILSFLLGRNDKAQRNNLLKIFYVTYSAYLLYAGIVYLSYKEINGFFLYPDQQGFYGIGESLSKRSSISQIFYRCFIQRAHLEQEGAYFLFGSIGYIANNYFDGNSVLLQSIYISFLAILSSLFIYKTLVYYVSNKQAFNYTLCFILLSPIFYYSPWILRDVHIAFLFSLGIYLIHTRFSTSRLLLFIPLILITIQFRTETGLFVLFMPFLYLYFQGKEHPYYKIILSAAIIIGIVFSSTILAYLSLMTKESITTIDQYYVYTSHNLGGGLGENFYHLPYGLKQVAIIVYSQLSTFPPWAGLEKTNTFNQAIVVAIGALNSAFWSFIFLFLIFSLSYKHSRKYLPVKSKVFLLIVLLFFWLNTSNMNVRRIMCIYPLLFIVYAQLRSIMQKRKIKLMAQWSILAYVLLITSYLLAKYY